MKPFLAALACLASASPAVADEMFGGVYSHDVDTPLTKTGGIESSVDLQLGWRGERITALSAIGSPSPYAFAAINTDGNTNFAAAGLGWKIGHTMYVRPGIGLAIHDGPRRLALGEQRIDFGSRLLFEPEFALGYQVNERVSVEASWVHLSHAQLFGRQNPGIDNMGVRVNYQF